MQFHFLMEFPLIFQRPIKSSIKNAIEALFGVKVVSVNTSKNPLKKKRVGKFFGTKSRTKRSFVKLAPEDSITFFENV